MNEFESWQDVNELYSRVEKHANDERFFFLCYVMLWGGGGRKIWHLHRPLNKNQCDKVLLMLTHITRKKEKKSTWTIDLKRKKQLKNENLPLSFLFQFFRLRRPAPAVTNKQTNKQTVIQCRAAQWSWINGGWTNLFCIFWWWFLMTGRRLCRLSSGPGCVYAGWWPGRMETKRPSCNGTLTIVFNQ